LDYCQNVPVTKMYLLPKCTCTSVDILIFHQGYVLVRGTFWQYPHVINSVKSICHTGRIKLGCKIIKLTCRRVAWSTFERVIFFNHLLFCIFVNGTQAFNIVYILVMLINYQHNDRTNVNDKAKFYWEVLFSLLTVTNSLFRRLKQMVLTTYG